MTELSPPPMPQTSAYSRGLGLLTLALASIFIVAHGCHGPDEDHEPGMNLLSEDSLSPVAPVPERR